MSPLIMAFKSSGIPVHKLQERTNKGIIMNEISSVDRDRIPVTMHRDDHYIFVFHESGSSKMILDFKEIVLEGAGIFYLLPAQAHQILKFEQGKGWFLAVDTSMVEEKYRAVFEERISQQKPLIPDRHQLQQIRQCAELLYAVFKQEKPSFITETVLHAFVSAYIGMFAEAYLAEEPHQDVQDLRPGIITRQFKKMLRSQFKTLKKPSGYASALCLSSSYLNECVKHETGFPVSYWIHQEIIFEAKRLLHYSGSNVKQIAFSLGYDDHAYFSRLFTRISGMSPLEFRRCYRE